MAEYDRRIDMSVEEMASILFPSDLQEMSLLFDELKATSVEETEEGRQGW